MTTEAHRGRHDDGPSVSTDPHGHQRIERLLIPNTTQVPNVILDFWMAVLTGAMLKVVLYLCRRTYGFSRTSDRISVQQLVSGIVRKKDGVRLDCGTGLSRSQTIATLNALEEVKIINKHSEKAHDGRNLPPEYSLNLAADPVEVARKLGEIKTRRSSKTLARKGGSAEGPKIGPSPSENRTPRVQKPDPQNLVIQNPGQNPDRLIDREHARDMVVASTDRPTDGRTSRGKRLLPNSIVCPPMWTPKPFGSPGA